MTIKLTTAPNSKGTLVLTCTFKDETNAVVQPTTITWTLTDAAGKVLNQRLNVGLSPSHAVIVLSGADLDYLDGHSRIVTVNALYDSNAGTGLALREQIVFPIRPLTEIK